MRTKVLVYLLHGFANPATNLTNRSHKLPMSIQLNKMAQPGEPVSCKLQSFLVAATRQTTISRVARMHLIATTNIWWGFPWLCETISTSRKRQHKHEHATELVKLKISVVDVTRRRPRGFRCGLLIQLWMCA